MIAVRVRLLVVVAEAQRHILVSMATRRTKSTLAWATVSSSVNACDGCGRDAEDEYCPQARSLAMVATGGAVARGASRVRLKRLTLGFSLRTVAG